MTGPSRDNVVALPLAAPAATVQGTLALALQPRDDPPRASVQMPRGGADLVSMDGRARRELEAWSCRFAQAAVEIVGGDRPAAQLIRWASAEVYADLNRRALLVARAGGYEAGQSRVQSIRPRVVGVRTCFLESDIAEAGLHIRYGRRSRAVAARFERTDGRWVCTALEFA
jgi:hypothetical protein